MSPYFEHALIFLAILLIALAMVALIARKAKGDGLFQTMLTEDDANLIFCPMRIVGLLIAVVFLFLVSWDTIVNGKEFSYTSFALAAAGLVTSLGAALILKKRSDP